MTNRKNAGGSAALRLEVAVVGGGISGLYVASRLASSGKYGRDQIALFEAGTELGGRIRSIDVPLALDFQAELGAMRIPRSHRLAMGLLERNFVPEELMPFSKSDRMWNLRGLRSKKSVSRAIGRRYYNSKLEARPDPEKLFVGCIRAAIKNCHVPAGTAIGRRVRFALRRIARGSTPSSEWYSLLTASDWRYFKDHAVIRTRDVEKNLRDVGFWNLMHHYLGSDGYAFVHDTFGYESIVSNWNAAEAIPWFCKDFSGGMVTPCSGMQRLVEKLLLDLLGHREINSIYPTRRLVELRPPGRAGGNFELVFEDTTSPGSFDRVLARRVVLALPKLALQRLALFEGPIWKRTFEREHVEQSRIRRNLESVTEHALFKMFIVFEEPWWTVPKGGQRMREGWRAATDEPLRQVYHFVAPRQDGGPPLGVVMASYSDEHYADFWRPMARRVGEDKGPDVRPFCKIKEPTAEEKVDLENWGVPSGFVNKAIAQLKELHGVDTLPRALVAYAKDWNDPFSYGGWHTWNPKTRPVRVMSDLAEPIPGLHICGEAYSGEQGWIEGALKSAELVLSRVGLSPPVWWTSRSMKDLVDYCLS